jgi:hypothetical protein
MVPIKKLMIYSLVLVLESSDLIFVLVLFPIYLVLLLNFFYSFFFVLFYASSRVCNWGGIFFQDL